MKKLIYTVSVLAGFFIIGQNAMAQGYSLEAARTAALLQSASLNNALVDIEIAGLDEKTAFYKKLPSLSLSGSGSTSASQNSSLGENISLGVSLRASQTIWDGGRVGIQSAISKIASAEARLAAEETMFKVLDTIDEAWYGLLKARASVVSAESSLAATKANFDIAETRYSTGRISRIDLLEAEAALVEAKNKVLSNQTAANLAAVKIISLTGIESLIEIEEFNFAALAETIEYLASADPHTLYINLKTQANRGNPALAKTALIAERATFSVKTAISGYSPSVSASADGGLSFDPLKGTTQPRYSISLSANVPLAFWETATAVKSAELSKRKTLTTIDETARTLDIVLFEAAGNAIIQARSILAGEKSVEYATALYEAKQEQYRLGNLSVAALTEAATQLDAKNNGLISARYAFLSSLSSIRSLAGLKADEDVPTLLN